MWEFYLVVSEVAFRRLGLTVFQIQLAQRPDMVSMTRDYIAAIKHTRDGTRATDVRAPPEIRRNPRYPQVNESPDPTVNCDFSKGAETHDDA